MYDTAPQSPGSLPLPNLSGIRWNSRRVRKFNLLQRCGLDTVLVVDRVLRHQLRIHEFTDCAECVLRISRSWSRSTVKLPDRIEIIPGDLLLELHLWNEHLGDDDSGNHGFAWEIRLLKRIHLSLVLLAEHVEQDPAWKECKAVHARFVTSLRRPERTIRYLGFSTTSPPASVGRKVHDFFENFLIYSLVWAFHPYCASWKKRDLKRAELWLSKARLLKMYGYRKSIP